MTGLFVHGDWGSTRLRLFLVDDDGAVLDQASGPGIAGLPVPPADVFRTAIESWLQRGVRAGVLCGMAGSRNGMREVGYVACPCDRVTWAASCEQMASGDFTLAIAPGLACRNEAGNPDVMRGEETQIFGAMALRPALATGSHMAVLPGTHSKWALLRDGQVIRFHTALTGELFALLATGSSLVTADARRQGEEEGFAAGLAQAKAAGGLLGTLFTARAAQLRDDRTGGWARGFLSGLLIGGEIDGLSAASDPLPPLTLIGAPALLDRYMAALQSRDLSAHTMNGDECVRAGLQALHRTLRHKDAP